MEEAVDRVVLLKAGHRQVERHVRTGQAEAGLDHQEPQEEPDQDEQEPGSQTTHDEGVVYG